MIDHEKEQMAADLKGSLLAYIQTFYPLLTGREFIISKPIGRESHHITICRLLTQIFRGEAPSNRININIEPGSGKSTLLSFWVTWCLAHYPDCRFIYVSYSVDLATKHTETIKRIMQLPHYKYLFDTHIRSDSKAKAFFQTNKLGAVAAFGTNGSVTGQDAGLPGEERFTGALIIDDAHKPSEAHSDTIRASVIDNYDETIRQRPRGINVPILHIGQRVHEDDLTAYFLSGNDVDEWHSLALKSLDDAGNALFPEKMPREKLLALQEKSPYVFASQYQQDPLPAGGSIFKSDKFVILDEEPEMLGTFICADTAETSKNYNDATAFGFFGVYEIEEMGIKTGDLGIQVLDIREIWVEPKDLKEEFMSFYQDCLLHPVKPRIAAIEKKSTGVTLISILNSVRGLEIRNIERNASSGSKATRFLACQPIVNSGLVSFPSYGKHTEHAIKHMAKITANDSHARDDIADVICDAIDLALIRKSLIFNTKQSTHIAATILGNQKKALKARGDLYGGNQGGF